MNSRKILRPLRAITMTAFGFFLLSLPGYSQWQVTEISPPAPLVAGYELNLSKADIPIKPVDVKEPVITAKAGFAFDADSAVTLFAKNADQPFMPASTTKIMTAIVALENYDPTDRITIKDEYLSIGSKSDLVAGETLTVAEVIKALLISSGNDAALALGQHDKQGYNHFVDLMNQKAKELHLENTHFSNVSGVEQSDHFISARDLGFLTKTALENPIFAGIVSTPQTTITNTDGTIIHQFENTNQLLGEIPGVDGVKTGWTQKAGECLVTSISRQGHRVIVVLLDSTDRFGESTALINWIFKHYTWGAFPADVIPRSPAPTSYQPPAPTL